jgi:hypothetical protein
VPLPLTGIVASVPAVQLTGISRTPTAYRDQRQPACAAPDCSFDARRRTSGSWSAAPTASRTSTPSRSHACPARTAPRRASPLRRSRYMGPRPIIPDGTGSPAGRASPLSAQVYDGTLGTWDRSIVINHMQTGRRALGAAVIDDRVLAVLRPRLRALETAAAPALHSALRWEGGSGWCAAAQTGIGRWAGGRALRRSSRSSATTPRRGPGDTSSPCSTRGRYLSTYSQFPRVPSEYSQHSWAHCTPRLLPGPKAACARVCVCVCW